MPNDIPCPNPGCTHSFPAASVTGVAALVCPQCGGVFQVKAKNRSVEEPASPAYQPARRSATLAWMLAGLIVFTSVGLMTAAFYRRTTPPPSTGPEPYRSIENNYSILMPASPWHRDEVLAKRLGGVLAFRRENPGTEAVWAVRHYPTYVPTLAELRDEAAVRLRKYPTENLQREDKPAGGTFAGQPAGRFVFQGSIDGTLVSGDVQFLTYQGAAYWLFRWCPAAEVQAATPALADMADRFALLDLHPDWRPPRRTFSGTKAKYSLTAEGDRWDKAPYPPEKYDPAADLALLGKSQEGAAEPTRAQLLVIILPNGEGDAINRARAYLLDRQKEIYPETTVTELPVAADTTATDPRLLSMDVKNTQDRQRFVMLGVVPRKDGPLMIWAECDLARRAIWEADFRKLIESYTPTK